ncbi:MAG: U32 family peptidase [Fermentimonas sp.]|nr:U32 family peptidase [Fermentimonas sp.]
MKLRQNYEIMSPAGSYESLMAAIQGGADSIYFGIEGLNMRSKSSNNFTIDDLHKIVAICKESNIKSYLTVNTIIYNNDMALMRKVVDAAKEANLSAIIAADVAVLVYARSIGVEVHLSTQLNITNTESLKFYAQYADVVVLARELNLDQVATIHKDIVEQQIKGPKGELVQIEMFAHGALCMAVSGKCYLSLHEKDLSANRGACNQICRRGYIVKDKTSDIELEIDNEYIMSPKDLKTIHFMNKMLDAGVRVFKIEGRARGPEYVRLVTTCYREAIESYCDDTFTQEKIDVWNEKLSTVFNRGFWDGYYLGQRLGEWTHRYGSGATKRKVYVGKAIKHFGNLGVTEFLIETQSVKAGDELLVTGPTTGALFITADDIRVDMQTTQEAVKGDFFSIKTNEKIRPNDQLYKMVDANRKGTAHER